MANDESNTGFLARLSEELATATATIATTVVRVDDTTRLTASGVSLGDGYIVAASHAVERDDELSIVTADGTRHAVVLVGRDRDTDIALLKADVELPAAPLVTAAPRVGEIAVAVARPGEMGLTATLGLVSQIQETETEGNAEFIVSTDATLFPGFSGGALINASGAMIGLLNRLYGHGAGVALGASLVVRVVERLKVKGTTRPGYLGVRTQLVPLQDSTRTAQSIEQLHGLLIVSVQPGSAAEAAGLLIGDTLLSVDNHAIEDVDALRHHLIAGETITIGILRGGAVATVTATVAGTETTND